MSAMRFVSVDKAVKAVRRALGTQNPQASFERWLEKQDPRPELVGVAEAALILDLPKPRISRLRQQGRMPSAVAELISGPVWLKSEVEALAVEVAAERSARAEKRDAKAEPRAS